MNLKDTLNLPDADFTIPMRAGLPSLEPEIQARWEAEKVYHQIQENRKDSPRFVLHDGPPYTNGPIHIGTALNKILKDFVVKSQTLMGKRAPYVPGFDNHGLPIEMAVMKKFEEKGVRPSIVELRKACREHAEKYIDVQTNQFKRLGVFGLWEQPYTSMEFAYEAEIVRVFKRLVEGGYIYRGLRPVLWSPSSQTALADTEIVYKDVVSKSIYVRFPLAEDPKGIFEGLENPYTIIWTTTPWTIPANLAVAFHPKLTYDIVRVGENHYLLVHELVETVMGKIGAESWEHVKSVKGRELEGTDFKHPVFDRKSVGVLADYVTTEEGTGVVHTAPGHGRDDFYTGAKYGLPVLCPVNEKGVLTEEAGEFAGTFYKKCDEVVVNRLDELGALLHVEDYGHSYPHAERDDLPVIFRATEQWFIGVDKNELRQRMIDKIDTVEFYPASGQKRITAMVANRPDWCISRQRPWGVGIPVFYGAESGEPILDPEIIERVAQLVEDEGSDAWYEKSAAEILPAGYKHPETGETEFRKEVDVFDVWFDSGCTNICVFEGNVHEEWKEEWPINLYLEGSDQHRGWFNVSLILGMAVKGDAPYREVLTHGFVTDAEGRKMSKRLGNVIDPNKVCEQYGADILRLWSASVNYENDVPCSDKLLQEAGEKYRRIRNTLRFLLSNLYDYEPADPDNLPPVEDWTPLDQWVKGMTDWLVAKCLYEYGRYNFRQIEHEVSYFCTEYMSAFYLDVIKDRMYCDGKDWPSRRSGQHACFYALDRLVKLVAPILMHTAEETYQRIPYADGVKLPSVHMTSLQPKADNPEGIEALRAGGLYASVSRLLEIREDVYSKLEGWKSQAGVKDSQDVEAVITLPSADYALLASWTADLPVLFKMAAVEIKEGDFSAEFQKSDFAKCDRSRLRRADVEEVQLDGQPLNLSERDRRVLGV